jgi:hypothetical protein
MVAADTSPYLKLKWSACLAAGGYNTTQHSTTQHPTTDNTTKTKHKAQEMNGQTNQTIYDDDAPMTSRPDTSPAALHQSSRSVESAGLDWSVGQAASSARRTTWDGGHQDHHHNIFAF